MIGQWIRAWIYDLRKEWITVDLRSLCGALGISPLADPRATFALVRHHIVLLQLDLQNEKSRSASLVKAKENRTEMAAQLSARLINVNKLMQSWPDSQHKQELFDAIVEDLP